jgi:hypothetical protein
MLLCGGSWAFKIVRASSRTLSSAKCGTQEEDRHA